MVGPLKGGTHKRKYLLVMVDKFTKWIEAKPVKSMRESFTRKAQPKSFNGVSPKRKGGIFWLKFMPDSVGTTPQPRPL